MQLNNSLQFETWIKKQAVVERRRSQGSKNY